MTVVAPAASNLPVRCSASVGGEARRTPTRSAATPIGTLMKNTQRQPGPSVSSPLAITPIDADVPPTAPKIPSARLRSCPSANVTARIDSAVGAISAAPKPCSPRALISSSADPCEPGEQRRDREDRQPDDEDAPPAEQVGEPAAEHQEPAEQQPVGDHDPLQGALADVEVALDRGQGDVHDGDVEHDHELGGTGQGQDQRPCCGGCLWSDITCLLSSSLVAALLLASTLVFSKFGCDCNGQMAHLRM